MVIQVFAAFKLFLLLHATKDSLGLIVIKGKVYPLQLQASQKKKQSFRSKAKVLLCLSHAEILMCSQVKRMATPP